MKNGITISIYIDGELHEYRYDADLKREFKTGLNSLLEQYLQFKAIECMHFMVDFMEEGQ